jgi:hypothetical protein
MNPIDILAIANASHATAWDRSTGALATAADLAGAIQNLSPRPRRGARVAVVSETLFSQRVRLASARTAALSPAELESALFYEVEPFCGIRREDAVLSAAHLPGGEWRVTVATRAELSALRDSVRAARCRFAGAAALPEPPPGGAPAAPPTPEAVAAALFPPGGEATPLLQPPREGLSPRNLSTASAIATLLVAILCAADWAFLGSAAHRLRPAVSESTLLAAANDGIRRDIAADADRLRAIEDARARRDAALAGLRAGRDRWLALLDTLSDGAGGRLVIRSIEADEAAPGASPDDAPPAVLVTGLAASPADAADAMARLAADLRPKGWELRPGTSAGHPGGATADFTFRARPLPLPTLAEEP